MEVRKVIGPPGTGKTTWVASQCRNAVEKYGDEGVLVCSLTRNAAHEAATKRTRDNRPSGLQRHMIGTLHSHAFHAFSAPKIVSPEQIAEWNREYPSWELSGGLSEDDDAVGFIARTDGDQMLMRADLLRARCTPEGLWPTWVRDFHVAWTGFKAAIDAWDFTDLIERAVHEIPLPPHNPSVIFADEAQDLSRLELKLLNRWMPHVEHVVLVGDPWQALYHWRGADPEALAGNVFKTLEQSHRVPRAVHAAAMELMTRSSTAGTIVYHPKKEAGEVERAAVRYSDPYSVMPFIEEAESKDQSVMVIGSCSFMLDRIARFLQMEGVPYFNPASRRWNPLHPARGVATKDRVLAFMRAESLRDFQLFAPLLKGPGIFRRGGKSRIEQLEEDTPEEIAARVIRESIEPTAMPIFDRSDPSKLEHAVEQLESALLASKQPLVKYPLTILRRGGVQALEQNPRVILGTIHSVKGAEADVVVVFPDLSPQGLETYERQGWDGLDAVLRMFYVAFTRAKHKLVLGEPSGGRFADV